MAALPQQQLPATSQQNDTLGTVYIVDDDPSILRSFTRLIRNTGLNVETFATPGDFLERCAPSGPACLLLDLAMPGMDGLQVQESMTQKGLSIPVVFITGHGDIPTSVRAMKSGAHDFLTKPVKAKALIGVIDQALTRDRERRLENGAREEILRRIATLTPREREVMNLVVAGKLNKQIAAELGCVEQTVKVHRGRMMEKMRAESVADLVRMTTGL